MSKEIEKIQGKRFCDDRGFVSFVNELDLSKYKRFYLVENHEKGFIRAWHGHKKESKAVMCLRGAVKIATHPMDLEACDLQINVLSAHSPQALVIPASYYNGAQTLTDDCIIMYLSDKSLEESHGDDFRLPWDQLGPEVWENNYR